MGRKNRFSVRFATAATSSAPCTDFHLKDTYDGPRSRSRNGCLGCRKRHIKCDEKFPVCTQCSDKNRVCMPRSRPTLWRVEFPWFQSFEPAVMPSVNRRLLRYWLENVCQVMTLDTDNNPLSFPIVQEFSDSKALVHALQSMSVGFECFYAPNAECLEERGKAMRTIRQDIMSSTAVRVQSFLAVFLLGLSSQWVDFSLDSYGEEHLMAARQILDRLLQQNDLPVDHPFRPLVIGGFIWWDMACSFLVEPSKQMPLDTPEIYDAVISLRGKFCTLISHATELFYHLCCLGRYCRALLDTGNRDLDFEEHIEQQLLTWEHSAEGEPLRALNESYRLHGLLMLYRLCGRSMGVNSEEYIRNRSLNILHNISQIKTDSPLFMFIALPLLSAGAELSEQDQGLRTRVVEWFATLSSYNRLQTYKWTTVLLQDLWVRKDAGDNITWLQLMVEKGWSLMLG